MINRWLKASRNTADGIKVLLHERAFREELFFGAIGLVLIYFLPFAALMKLLLVLLIMLLLVVEALNSAIEAVVDRISADIHPLSKAAKDIGSATVAMVIVMNIVAWGFALYPTFLMGSYSAP